MDIIPSLVAVDWGTTNRRVFLLDSAGRLVREEQDDAGVAALGRKGVYDAVALLRVRFPQQLIILAGMVGSALGWREVPYVACPAGLGSLIDGAIRDETGQIILIPGVRSAPGTPDDVMRGEEVQLIGAAEAGLIPADCPICHPGTHAKWVDLRGYAIQSFRTVMTGELFALLKAHSILAPALAGPVQLGTSFQAGLAAGLSSRTLGADLFSIRAKSLLGHLPLEDAASWASGLLIGADISFGLAHVPSKPPVALIGDPQLTALYAAGLEAAGRDCFELDGATAFIAGSLALAQRLPCPA